MRVICLPRGEEHGQDRDHCCKGASLCRSETHSRGLQKAGKSAIERIDAMAIDRVSSWSFGSRRGYPPTRTARPVRLRCLSASLACHRRCPWWSTSTSQPQSYSRPMTAPRECQLHPETLFLEDMLTGPTRSGTRRPRRPTLNNMQKKPIKVTIFGASHSGNNSTKAFHYSTIREAILGRGLEVVHSVLGCI